MSRVAYESGDTCFGSKNDSKNDKNETKMVFEETRSRYYASSELNRRKEPSKEPSKEPATDVVRKGDEIKERNVNASSSKSCSSPKSPNKDRQNRQKGGQFSPISSTNGKPLFGTNGNIFQGYIPVQYRENFTSHTGNSSLQNHDSIQTHDNTRVEDPAQDLIRYKSVKNPRLDGTDFSNTARDNQTPNGGINLKPKRIKRKMHMRGKKMNDSMDLDEGFGGRAYGHYAIERNVEAANFLKKADGKNLADDQLIAKRKNSLIIFLNPLFPAFWRTGSKLMPAKIKEDNHHGVDDCCIDGTKNDHGVDGTKNDHGVNDVTNEGDNDMMSNRRSSNRRSSIAKILLDSTGISRIRPLFPHVRRRGSTESSSWDGIEDPEMKLRRLQNEHLQQSSSSDDDGRDQDKNHIAYHIARRDVGTDRDKNHLASNQPENVSTERNHVRKKFNLCAALSDLFSSCCRRKKTILKLEDNEEGTNVQDNEEGKNRGQNRRHLSDTDQTDMSIDNDAGNDSIVTSFGLGSLQPTNNSKSSSGHTGSSYFDNNSEEGGFLEQMIQDIVPMNIILILFRKRFYEFLKAEYSNNNRFILYFVLLIFGFIFHFLWYFKVKEALLRKPGGCFISNFENNSSCTESYPNSSYDYVSKYPSYKSYYKKIFDNNTGAETIYSDKCFLQINIFEMKKEVEDMQTRSFFIKILDFSKTGTIFGTRETDYDNISNNIGYQMNFKGSMLIARYFSPQLALLVSPMLSNTIVEDRNPFQCCPLQNCCGYKIQEKKLPRTLRILEDTSTTEDSSKLSKPSSSLTQEKELNSELDSELDSSFLNSSFLNSSFSKLRQLRSNSSFSKLVRPKLLGRQINRSLKERRSLKEEKLKTLPNEFCDNFVGCTRRGLWHCHYGGVEKEIEVTDLIYGKIDYGETYSIVSFVFFLLFILLFGLPLINRFIFNVLRKFYLDWCEEKKKRKEKRIAEECNMGCTDNNIMAEEMGYDFADIVGHIMKEIEKEKIDDVRKLLKPLIKPLGGLRYSEEYKKWANEQVITDEQKSLNNFRKQKEEVGDTRAVNYTVAGLEEEAGVGLLVDVKKKHKEEEADDRNDYQQAEVENTKQLYNLQGLPLNLPSNTTKYGIHKYHENGNYWEQRLYQRPDSFLRAIRVAEAAERDESMFKPDFQIRYKNDAAFSDPNGLNVLGKKRVENGKKSGKNGFGKELISMTNGKSGFGNSRQGTSDNLNQVAVSEETNDLSDEGVGKIDDEGVGKRLTFHEKIAKMKKENAEESEEDEEDDEEEMFYVKKSDPNDFSIRSEDLLEKKRSVFQLKKEKKERARARKEEQKKMKAADEKSREEYLEEQRKLFPTLLNDSGNDSGIGNNTQRNRFNRVEERNPFGCVDNIKKENNENEYYESKIQKKRKVYINCPGNNLEQADIIKNPFSDKNIRVFRAWLKYYVEQNNYPGDTEILQKLVCDHINHTIIHKKIIEESGNTQKNSGNTQKNLGNTQKNSGNTQKNSENTQKESSTQQVNGKVNGEATSAYAWRAFHFLKNLRKDSTVFRYDPRWNNSRTSALKVCDKKSETVGKKNETVGKKSETVGKKNETVGGSNYLTKISDQISDLDQMGGLDQMSDLDKEVEEVMMEKQLTEQDTRMDKRMTITEQDTTIDKRMTITSEDSVSAPDLVTSEPTYTIRQTIQREDTMVDDGGAILEKFNKTINGKCGTGKHANTRKTDFILYSEPFSNINNLVAPLQEVRGLIQCTKSRKDLKKEKKKKNKDVITNIGFSSSSSSEDGMVILKKKEEARKDFVNTRFLERVKPREFSSWCSSLDGYKDYLKRPKIVEETRKRNAKRVNAKQKDVLKLNKDINGGVGELYIAKIPGRRSSSASITPPDVNGEFHNRKKKMKLSGEYPSIPEDVFFALPEASQEQIVKPLGVFISPKVTAEKIGLIPHRISETPITSRLLVKQKFAKRDAPTMINENTPVDKFQAQQLLEKRLGN